MTYMSPCCFSDPEFFDPQLPVCEFDPRSGPRIVNENRYAIALRLQGLVCQLLELFIWAARCPFEVGTLRYPGSGIAPLTPLCAPIKPASLSPSRNSALLTHPVFPFILSRWIFASLDP
jgi:hypothetical protein